MPTHSWQRTCPPNSEGPEAAELPTEAAGIDLYPEPEAHCVQCTQHPLEY